MNTENDNRNVTDQSTLGWAGILGVSVLLLATLGTLIYFFVVAN